MATSLNKRATTVSENGLAVIKSFEGLRLKSYKDVVGVWTIGYGSTHWEDGKEVKSNQSVQLKKAIELLNFEAKAKSYIIAQSLPLISLNQNQFDSLVSFVYNVGMKGFLGSTLFKLIKLNPKDPNITKAFMMWVKGTKDGKKITIPSLITRRKEEAKLYFS